MIYPKVGDHVIFTRNRKECKATIEGIKWCGDLIVKLEDGLIMRIPNSGVKKDDTNYNTR